MRRASTTAKTVRLAPMHRASVASAAKAKPGVLQRRRVAILKSVSMGLELCFVLQRPCQERRVFYIASRQQPKDIWAPRLSAGMLENEMMRSHEWETEGEGGTRKARGRHCSRFEFGPRLPMMVHGLGC